MDLASELLRGAAYTAFDGTPPAQPEHAGVGGTYAHATAPIRRLGDRFVNEVCAALVAGAEIPDWARTSLPVLPDLLAASGHRAHAFDRAVVDGTESWLLQRRVGKPFEGIIVDVEPRRHDKPGTARGTVMVDDPAVTARVDGEGLPLGERTSVRLETADPATRTVRFAYPA